MDPFAQMHQRMQRMHQEMMSDFPFMGGDVFGAPHHPRAFQERGHHGSTARTAGPQIEEVDDDDGALGDALAQAGGQEPVIEEPDDPYHHRSHRQRDRAPTGNTRPPKQSRHHQLATETRRRNDPFSMFEAMNQMMNFPSMNPGAGSTSYSYSSYSSSGGPNGVTYHESSSTRMGPGGVMETKHSVTDGRTGEQRMRLTRGLQDRQHTWERARRNGQDIHSKETLKGINSQEEAKHFDQEWHARASHSLLPGYGGGRSSNNADRYGLAAPGGNLQNGRSGAPVERQRSRALPGGHGDGHVRFM